MKRIITAAIAAALMLSCVSCGKKPQNDISYKDKGTLVWANDYVELTFVSLDTSDPMNPSAAFKAHNKTDEEMTLMHNALCLNDYHMFCADSDSIGAGKTVEIRVEPPEGAVETIGLDDIGKISAWFTGSTPSHNVFNDPSMVSGEIVIRTENTDWENDQPEFEGELIYNENGVKITVVYDHEMSMSGMLLPMCIENDSKKDILATLKNFRVNGVDIESSGVNCAAVYGGKKIFKIMNAVGIAAESEDGKENTVEVQFEIISYEGEQSVSELTDYITLEGISEW